MNIKNIIHYIILEVFKRDKTKIKNYLKSEMHSDREPQGNQNFNEKSEEETEELKNKAEGKGLFIDKSA